jgi:hypothetical protein
VDINHISMLSHLKIREWLTLPIGKVKRGFYAQSIYRWIYKDKKLVLISYGQGKPLARHSLFAQERHSRKKVLVT